MDELNYLLVGSRERGVRDVLLCFFCRWGALYIIAPEVWCVVRRAVPSRGDGSVKWRGKT